LNSIKLLRRHYSTRKKRSRDHQLPF